MLKNKKNSNTSRVKFISYTGEYPNLCSGVLTLEIDGVQYKFGHNYMEHHYDKNGNGYYADEDPMNPNFNAFWSSGGRVTCDGDWNWNVETDEWEIDVNELPQQFWDVAEEIDEVFNENVQYGCCGGCI
jgi:hypothetical protein